MEHDIFSLDTRTGQGKASRAQEKVLEQKRKLKNGLHIFWHNSHLIQV